MNAVKSFNILAIKLSSELYLIKFLAISTKLFFPCLLNKRDLNGKKYIDDKRILVVSKK